MMAADIVMASDAGKTIQAIMPSALSSFWGHDLRWWRDLANVGMVWCLVIAAMAAAGVVVCTKLALDWTGKIETHANALLVAYQLDVAGKVADAQTAGLKAGEVAGRAQSAIDAANVELAKQKTLTAQANASALEAQLALGRLRAPREISPEQQAAIANVAQRHNNVALDIFMVGDSPDIAPLAAALSRLLEAGGNWSVVRWTWVGVEPIHGALVMIKPSAGAEAVRVAGELIAAIDGRQDAKPQVWPGQWETFGGMLNGPAFDANRTEIRVIIGSKPL